MKMKKINNPINEKDIVKFEQQIGASLPNDYKSFLLNFNGGKPEHYIFPETDKLYSLAIDKLYGLNTENKTSNLYWNYDILNGYQRIMDQFIPIGSAINGDQFVLGISGDFTGKVYLWDHNQEIPYDEFVENKLPENMYKLTDSFDEFMNKLEEDTED